MIIKVLLTLGLLGAFSYVFLQSGMLRLIKLTTTVVIVLGIYFVWLPTHATLVAEVLGVGRGADLLMYFWIMVTLIVLLNLHLKLRATNIMLTKLTRHIAKLEATGTKEMDGERSS